MAGGTLCVLLELRWADMGAGAFLKAEPIPRVLWEPKKNLQEMGRGLPNPLSGGHGLGGGSATPSPPCFLFRNTLANPLPPPSSPKPQSQ